MAIRPILRFPDHRLSLPAIGVDRFDAELAALAGDLLDTMRAAPGIGITAPHIGAMQRVVVIELSPGDGPQTFVNPQITHMSDNLAVHAEGSVSMPGIVEDVTRPATIRMQFQDISGIGHDIEASGLLSVCLQHEVDQLDGVFWLHKLSRLKRDRAIKRFSKSNT